MIDDICPICKSSAGNSINRGANWKVNCGMCGNYIIPDEFAGDINSDPNLKGPNKKNWIKLSHYTRTQNLYGHEARFTKELIEELITSDFQTIHEQIENFIIYVGYKTKYIGVAVHINSAKDFPVIGAMAQESVIYIIEHLQHSGHIYFPQPYTAQNSPVPIILAVSGWELFDSIKRTRAESKQCFMAMQFDNEYVMRLYENHIKQAMSDLGFTIKLVTEDQSAGLIDDQLRVGINSSKFMIADVTNNNRNVYWEAGYAEGQNKPVIYICESGKFKKTPFDTNHRLHVTWEKGMEDDFIKKLSNTIKATFPEI